MSKTSAAMLLTMGLAGVSPLAWSEQMTLDRTFKVAPGGRLTVDADGGDVKVTGTDGDKVTVNIIAKGSRRTLDRLTLDAKQSADGVNVMAKRESENWLGLFSSWGDEDVTVTVTVPKRFDIEIATSGGDVVVSHVQGTTNGRTSGGDVTVDDLQGPVSMKTSGGDVDVTNIRGHVEMRTSGGDIRVHSVTGDFDGHTSGGNVQAEGISGSVQLHSSGGDIVAGHIIGPITAQTSGGNVRLDRIDGAMTAGTSGGDVAVELVGANRGISLSTSGGGIVMVLPEKVAATLDASSGNGRVRSELPVANAVRGGPSREESRLAGTINGGGERIHARTSGGNIVLRAKEGDRTN